jgi:ParB-like chromosome segregation protein Spo0J
VTAPAADLPQPELTREWVPTDEIRHHPDNKRKGDVPKIERSLRDHGQFRAILVQRSTRYAVVGNHTLKAARNVGKDKVLVDWIDCDDAEALELLLVDNASSDGAEYDERGLAEVLSRLAENGRDVERAGFSEAQAHELARVTGLLSEQSTGFLEGLEGETPEQQRHAAGEGREYHQLGWPVTADQRDTILAALKQFRDGMPARDGGERPTTIDALVALCEDYMHGQAA